MEYLVTALCVVLSVGVSVMAFRFLDRYLFSQRQDQADVLPAECADGENRACSEEVKISAAHNAATNTPSSVLPEMNVKRWFQLILCCLLCGGVCFLRICRNGDWLRIAETALCVLSLSSVAIIDGEIKKIPNKLVLLVLAAGAVLLAIKCIADPKNQPLVEWLQRACGCIRPPRSK